MTVFEVDNPTFKVCPLFVVDCDFARLTTYLAKHWKVEPGIECQHAGMMLTFDQPPWRVVWVKDQPDTYERLGVFLHEIFHLVTRICQDKGVPIKAQTAEGLGDEAAAYLFDFFAREAMPKAGVRLVKARRR